MYTKNEYPQKISNEIIKKAMELSTTLLADAMNGNGSMDYNIQALSSEIHVLGTAITIETALGDNLFLHQAIYDGGPEYVLVVEGKGHMSNAYMGGLMTRSAQAVGLEGIIVDGAVRDKDELLELNYPIFSKGFCPSGPNKKGPGSINNNIICGGVFVKPGDLIMGDCNGVVVVPREDINEVIIKAEKKLKYELERIKTINDYVEKKKLGEKFPDIEPKWLKSAISDLSNEIGDSK